MNERVKKLWVDALRGDEFMQGRQALRTPTADGPQDCCLGVLCELYRREHPFAEWLADGSFTLGEELGVTDDEGVIINYSEVLPPEVAKWAGLDSEDPTFNVNGETLPASVANDDREMSFAQIADLVEANL